MLSAALDFPKTKSYWPLLHFSTGGHRCCKNELNPISKEWQLQDLLVYDVQTVHIKTRSRWRLKRLRLQSNVIISFFKVTPLEPNLQSFIIFWDFLLVFYQIFLSPQAKRWAIITYKHGIYWFPHELPNDLKLMI